MNKPAEDLIPGVGERLLLIGQTGSGKTVFGARLLEHVPATPIFILDSKGDESFESVEQRIGIHELRGLTRGDCDDYVVLSPGAEDLADPEALDKYVSVVHEQFTPCTLYVDELYMLHKGARAYPGLVGAYTRGRSAGLTLIGCSQRPSWISRFSISESTAYAVFRLVDESDRKKLAQVIPLFDKMPVASDYKFWYFRQGWDHAELYEPVPFNGSFNFKVERESFGDMNGVKPRLRWL